MKLLIFDIYFLSLSYSMETYIPTGVSFCLTNSHSNWSYECTPRRV